MNSKTESILQIVYILFSQEKHMGVTYMKMREVHTLVEELQAQGHFDNDHAAFMKAYLEEATI